MPMITTFIIGIVVILFPLLYSDAGGLFSNEISACNTILFLIVISIICTSIHLFSKKKKTIGISVSIVDLLAGLFALWFVINILFVSNNKSDSFIWYIGGAVGGFYLLVRNLLQKWLLLYAYSISGTIQAIIAILQQSGFISSNNSYFDVTGSFFNPGQLAGYISVCCVITICVLVQAVKNRGNIRIILLAFSCILQCYGMYLTDSRAGLVGLFGGILISTNYFLPIFRKYKVISVITTCIIITIAGILLYNYRPASADGRLLVWRVSADMIADKPLTGHGIGGFAEKYMIYQGEYFTKNPTSYFIPVADNVLYPFNEFINLTIQFGIIGLVLLLAILYFVFKSHSSDHVSNIFKAGLATWWCFSFFSYPAEILPLLLLLPLCLGNINSPALFSIKLPRWILTLSILLIIAVAMQTVKEQIFVNHLSRSITRLRNERASHNDIAFINNSYDRMKYNTGFNIVYMSWLNNQTEPLYKERLRDILPTCEKYCLLGKYYMEKEDYIQAEYILKLASNMVPTRIRPKYYLWELYNMTDNKAAATAIAYTILSTPVKIESIYTIKIKAKINEYLQINLQAKP